MKGKFTKFLSLIMCVAVTVTSISLSDYGTVRANANTGGSAELPSVTKYATKNDLTDKSKFSLWGADGGVAQKVYFGYDSTNEVARTWYIAGKDGDGSLVLMCDPTNTFGNQMFNETLDKSSYESNEVYANHYGASDIRKYLSGDALNSFSSKEQDLMIDKEILSNDTKNSSTYLTSDKLYLAYGDYQDRYITVGANSKNSLNSGIKIGLNSNGSTGSAYIDSENGGFWLRAPYARFNYDAQFAGPGYDVSPFCVTNSAAVVPAFNLNLSSVLFASAAKAASSQSKLEDAMTFRIDAKDKIQSTAEYNANQINVSKGTDSGELYLYVQGKDSTGEWVWSEKVPSDGELFDIADIRSGLSTTASCKIWLETQNGNDNLVYAKEALETQKIFRRINVKANDNIMGKASADKKIEIEGKSVELSVSANAGYHFVKWESEDVTVADNEFAMPAKDVTVTAVFAPCDLEWKTDETSHWKECKDCGYKTSTEAHTYGDWESDETNHWRECKACKYVDTAKHLDTNNNEKCDVCGYNMHIHKYIKVPQVDSTVDTYGVKEYYKCSCGKYYKDAEGKNEITDLEAWKAGEGRIEKKEAPAPNPNPDPDAKLVAIVGQKINISGRFDTASLKEGEKIAAYSITDKKEKKLAAVNKMGEVTPKKSGVIHVTAYKKEGKKVEVGTVELKIVSPAFDKKAMKATFDGETVSATLLVSDFDLAAKNQTVSWKSSKTKIATIDEATGLITAHKSGKTNISVTFTNSDGKSVTKKSTFTVKIPKLNVKDSISLKNGKTKKLSLSNVEKTDSITWSTSDESTVSIESNGKKAKIKAMASGSAEITANVNGHSYKTIVTVK